MDLCMYESCLFEQELQFLGRIGTHAIHQGFGIIVCIAVGTDNPHKIGSAVLDTVIQLTDTAHEGVTIRLAVTAAEKGYGLIREIGIQK